MSKFVVLLLFGSVVRNIYSLPFEEDKPLSGDDIQNALVAIAKHVGLQGEQLEASVNVLLELINNRTSVSIISFLADNCPMLNADGLFLEIDEKRRDKFIYADVADQNITSRLKFWGRYINGGSSDNLFIALKNICVEFMSPVERKIIEDMAKEAGIHEDDIPHMVDLQMKIYLDADNLNSHKNYVLKENYEKLGKNQYTLDVPSAEKELEKLKSENLSENYLADSLYFWAHKYLETTGVDQLKSLKNLCVVLMRMRGYLPPDFDIFEKRNELLA